MMVYGLIATVIPCWPQSGAWNISVHVCERQVRGPSATANATSLWHKPLSGDPSRAALMAKKPTATTGWSAASGNVEFRAVCALTNKLVNHKAMAAAIARDHLSDCLKLALVPKLQLQ